MHHRLQTIPQPTTVRLRLRPTKSPTCSSTRTARSLPRPSAVMALRYSAPSSVDSAASCAEARSAPCVDTGGMHAEVGRKG